MLRITLVHLSSENVRADPRKDTVLSSWTSGRPQTFDHDFGRKVKRDPPTRSMRSGHQRGVTVEDNSWRVRMFTLWRSRDGWTSKKPHGAFMLDQPDSVMDSDWLWRRSIVTVCEAYILHLTKSMPINTSEQVKASRKSHTLLSSETPDLVVRSPDSVRDSRLTLKKVKKWLFQKVTSYLWQGQCRSGHRWRSVLRATADKQNIDLCDGQGWTSKRTRCFQVELLEDRRFRHGFPTEFWRRSSLTVCEAHILHLTKSMPIKTSEKVKASRKSRTVLSCLTSSDLSLRLISLVRFRRRFPIDSEEGPRVIVSEGLCRSGHQRKVSVEDNISPFWALRRSGLNSKRTRCFQVGLLEGHPIPSWTSDWLWIRSSATVWEGYVLPPTRSMPIRHQRRSVLR